MNSIYNILKSSAYALLSIFFLSNCSTTATKQSSQKTYKVEINQMKFEPEELWVRTGDTVIFINNDMVTHNITERTNNLWTSSALVSNASWKMIVMQDEDYYCTIHPMMKGKLRIINKVNN